MGTQTSSPGDVDVSSWHPYLNEFSLVMKIYTDIQYNVLYKANVCLVFSSTAEILRRRHKKQKKKKKKPETRTNNEETCA